ncbi:MAG: T9SS type A sorting domain-containing protein [Bacteroidota bacterium]|nr:T9SS type A sorting domain-containing protein [Bacteroidota bacterium]
MKRLSLIIVLLIILNLLSESQQKHWEKVNNGLPDTNYVSSIIQFKNYLFVGCRHPFGIYRSSDFGQTWQDRSIKFVGSNLSLPVLSLYVVGDTIFAGTAAGIYKTINDGETWNESDNVINGGNIYSFLQLDSLLFVSTDKGVYQSKDYGHYWDLKSKGLPLNYNGDPFTVRKIYSVGEKIYAGVDASFQLKGGLFVSTDMGESWTKVLQNWIYTYNGSTISTDVYSIEYFDGFLYIYSNGFWIMKSSDEGKTWIEDNGNLSGWVLYSYKNYLFSTGNPYLWVKTKGNQIWKDISFNLTKPVTSIYCIDSLIFVGTDLNGLWKTTLSNLTMDMNIDTFYDIPSNYSLEQNYPNPFNPSTTISYSLPTSSLATLRIFDMLGRVVRIVFNELQNGGEHSVSVNVFDLPSGMYFYQLRTENFVQTKKMMLLK